MRVRVRRALDHLRRQWMGALALFLVLSGGVAYSANTIASSDIIDGQVKSADLGADAVNSSKIANGQVGVADLGQGAVATDELANGQVKATDIGDGEVKGAEIANGQVQTADIGDSQVRGSHVLNDNLTGADIAANTLKGADIDENSLDIGDTARAYAVVSRFCAGSPQICSVSESKGVSSVDRESTGVYCVTAPGINSGVTPAVVSINWNGTNAPEGNASVFSAESAGCGPGGQGFTVYTYFGPTYDVVDSGGTLRSVRGSSFFSDEVGFTIVIP